MVSDGDSVLFCMRPLKTITIALLAGFSTTSPRHTHLAEAIPASAATPSIAMAVTELLPSIDNCVTVHQARCEGDVTFDIAFDVRQEVVSLSPASGSSLTDSCIEHALSALSARGTRHPRRCSAASAR